MTDLVLISLERWDDVWRRNQHLIAGLLRRDPELRVLFVEPSVDPVHDLSRRRRPERPRGLRPPPALEGVAAGRLWLLETAKWLPRRFDPRADARRADRVVAAARRLGFTAPVLWVNDPDGASVLQATRWPTLYDITDDWLLADRPEGETARRAAAESVLMERASVVVVCSPSLARSKGAQREVVLVPNAVDVEKYRQLRARPEDLPAGGCAVYVGTVHRDRMDLDLCRATAIAVAGLGSLVVVGPVALDNADVTALQAAGVVLLGARPAGDVPGYLQHADVLVVPHVVTPFTDSLDPIKLYEYRAARRPVVTTPVAGFRDAADPLVTVVEPSDFAAAVRRVLEHPSQGTVPAVSEGPAVATGGAPATTAAAVDIPSWADRVEQMSHVLERVVTSAGRTDPT